MVKVVQTATGVLVVKIIGIYIDKIFHALFMLFSCVEVTFFLTDLLGYYERPHSAWTTTLWISHAKNCILHALLLAYTHCSQWVN